MSWYTNWFDSNYYYILYQNRNNDEAKFFIDNLINYLKIKKDSKLIDIACGKGRHSIYLNKIGIDVVGTDLSKRSIYAAKKKENKKLNFFVHDMRKTFEKDGFDYAFNLFTSFGYFEDYLDNQKTINSISDNLKNGGTLVLDFMNVEKTISNLVKSEYKEIDNIKFFISRELKNNFIIKKITIKDGEKKLFFNEQVNALNIKDFKRFFKKCNLKIVDTFGDYSLNKFNIRNSDRLIFIAKKEVE